MGNLAIIPARSGSKAIKDKNIYDLNGKPLIAYSIESALASMMFDDIIVSTDSEQYADISRQYGAEVPFLRSAETSGDSANSWSVVREVVNKLSDAGREYDRIMLLQPTSPLRTAENIENSFVLMEEKQANSILSVVEVEHSPLWCNTIPEDGCMDHFRRLEYADLPRQELPVYYRMNGAIYLINIEELAMEPMFANRCYAYVMPQERSVDIDTKMDFLIAEMYLKGTLGSNK